MDWPSAQECRCQKQPLTKITLRCERKTRSGQPGRRRTCSRYRAPSRQTSLRTTISGFVSLPQIEAMLTALLLSRTFRPHRGRGV